LTPEPTPQTTTFRSRARVNEYQIIEEEKKKLIERMQRSKRNYTFKYTHLNYKTLKYSAEDVFKSKDKDKDKKAGISSLISQHLFRRR